MFSTKIKGVIQKSGGRVVLGKGTWMVQKTGSNAALGLAWILWCYPAAFYMLLQCKCWMFEGCLGDQPWHFGGWQAGDSRRKRVSTISVLKLENNGLFYCVKMVLHCQQATSCFGAELALFQEQRTHPGCGGIPFSFNEKSPTVVELQYVNW